MSWNHPARVGFGTLMILAGLPSCFVDSGDCVAHGVRVDPCTIPMKIGQTRTFSATVTADPDETVNWIVGPAVDLGFDPVVDGNELQLVGTLGVGGVYKIRAQSAADPERFGEAIISVSTNSYGFPPPPVQVNGTDFPNDYQGAVAVGGSNYYVAYADPPFVVAARAVPDNFFVQQFGLATNTPLASVENQFTLFGAGDPNAPVPNIAADCQGNGYWLDRPDASSPIEIRRLSAAGALSTFLLANFDQAGPMAVSCNGAIYFFAVATGGSLVELFKIPAFGDAPAVFDIPAFPFAGATFDSIATDPENRILLGDQNPDGTPVIIRVIPDPLLPTGEVDAAFADPGLSGVTAITVDGQNVVYGADSTTIFALNSVGKLIYMVDMYLYNCPEGCIQPECGTMVPFQNIRSIAASTDGRLRVIDDVTLGLPPPPPECQVTLRLILIEP